MSWPPQVRQEAYTALARYSMERLEELELARPLREHARLLCAEADAAAARACSRLVSAALAYEHARRRRCVHMPPARMQLEHLGCWERCIHHVKKIRSLGCQEAASAPARQEAIMVMQPALCRNVGANTAAAALAVKAAARKKGMAEGVMRRLTRQLPKLLCASAGGALPSPGRAAALSSQSPWHKPGWQLHHAKEKNFPSSRSPCNISLRRRAAAAVGAAAAGTGCAVQARQRGAWRCGGRGLQ